MKWIGFDKNDPEQRKFEFDDSVVLTSDPPQYSIRFLDTNETTSVTCSSVFKLKPVKPFNKKPNVKVVDRPPVEMQQIEEGNNFENEITDEQLQMDIANELRPVWEKQKSASQPHPQTITDVTNTDDNRLFSGTVEVKKKTTRKKKTDDNTIGAVSIPTSATITLQEHKYEYKTMLVDLESVSSLQDKLNELGEKYWELINFEVVQSILPNKSRLFCIMKRNK